MSVGRRRGVMARKRGHARAFGVGGRLGAGASVVLCRGSGEVWTRRAPCSPSLSVTRVSEGGSYVGRVCRAIGWSGASLATPPTIALPGGATPAARADILRVLRLPGAEGVVSSFGRPNLALAGGRVGTVRYCFRRLREVV